MRLWIWRNFRLELPEDWEMLQFARDPDEGRCAFADRYRYRLEFAWRRVPGPPDFERMMSDYQAQLTGAGNLEDARSARAGSWWGFRGRTPQGETARWGSHFAREQCLVEIVLLWPGPTESSVEQEILQKVREEAARGDGWRRWRAFGLDLLAAPDSESAECTVQPARVNWSFARERGAIREQRFQRLGMVREWLRGNVGDWLATQTPLDVSHPTRSTSTAQGHHVECLRGEWRTNLVERWRRRRIEYLASAWICPADGRLYHTSRTARGAIEAPTLAGMQLSCCQNIPLPV